MSTIEANPEVADVFVTKTGHEVTAARNARVGDLAVRRLLPLRTKRSVGAWCFIDHYGPADTDGSAGMNVPPHPHIGLQTVTWLIRGNVLHRDSLGSEQLIRPGQLNLMTSGRGIAHAEESVPGPSSGRDPVLHGVQLWLALPEASRHVAPAFEHHAALPGGTLPDGTLPDGTLPDGTLPGGTRAGEAAADRAGTGRFEVTVFIGELLGLTSPATTFSPVVGAQLAAAPGQHAAGAVALRPDFEHAIFAANGRAEVDGVPLTPGELLYLPAGPAVARVAAARDTILILLGGVPLGERLLMWWNFVARTPAEIEAATAAWRAGEFGAVGGYQGDPLPAPPLDAARLRIPR